MGRLSPRELASILAPSAARAAASVNAASQADPAALALESAAVRLLGVEPSQVSALWMGLDRSAPSTPSELARALVVDIELVCGDETPALLGIRRSGEDRPAAFRSGHFAFTVKTHRGAPTPPGINRIAEHVRRVDPSPPALLGDEARALLTAFAERERIERDPTAWSRETSARDLTPEEAPIALLAKEYERYFGRPPAFRRMAGAPGPSIELPARDLPDQESFFRLPERIRSSPRSASYLRRFGFGWDDDGVVRTVPTPATFLAARDRHGLAEMGFTPSILSLHSTALFARRWLLSSTDAVLAVNLATEAYYALSRPLRSRLALRSGSIQRDWTSHFTTLGHDMSVHLLSTHLVPRELLIRIGEHVRRALRSLPLRDRVLAPHPLLTFYDTDLFLYARERWQRLDRLADLPGELTTEPAIAALLERLDQRINEAQSGRPPGAP